MRLSLGTTYLLRATMKSLRLAAIADALSPLLIPNANRYEKCGRLEHPCQTEISDNRNQVNAPRRYLLLPFPWEFSLLPPVEFPATVGNRGTAVQKTPARDGDGDVCTRPPARRRRLQSSDVIEADSQHAEL
jgi:hypothetical protein